MSTHLPVDDVLSDIAVALGEERIVLLEAPPGAGKTTRVPPSLIDLDWVDHQKIIVLEPRRVAARAAAQRMARERGEKVGDTIGLRTRADTRTGPRTRIEVVTEGVLTRMLLDDPSLDGVRVVVFDEFHERSIHADTALVFALDTIDALRPDMKLLIMSATLNTETLADRLGTNAVIRAEGRTFPVTTIYRPPAPGRDADGEVPDAVVDALSRYAGDVLVFMAGTRNIFDAQRSLGRRLGNDVVITPLHGMLPADQQDLALRPDQQHRRKVILSTPIAETSVTIDGVGVVIDTGRRRQPQIDLSRGMSRLHTIDTSRASTDQRRGRAGRQAPGFCVRLWPESDQSHRRRDDIPEILTADLTQLALQIAAWGVADPTELNWIDQPPGSAFSAAQDTLVSLTAIDDNHRITEHGRRMIELGTEPRLAHLILAGVDIGMGGTACDIAAVLSDRDLLRGRDRPIDLRARIDALRHGGRNVDAAARARARDSAHKWRRRVGAVDDSTDLDQVGALVSLAYPDWICKRRRDPGTFLLASGSGASVPVTDELAREPYLVVAELQGAGPDARIRIAAPISIDDIERLHQDRIEETVSGGWNRRTRDVIFEDQTKLGAIVLARSPTNKPPRESVVEALLAGVRREGLDVLGWTSSDHRFQERLSFMHHIEPDTWPDSSNDHLVEIVDEWLVPALARATSRSDLQSVDVKSALANLIGWRSRRDIDRLAPTHVVVPSGSRIPIDYSDPSAPALAVRLQEVFGLHESPAIADGDVKIVLHLLSPAHRPVQVTSDLSSFWESGYPEVRRELRGRYPKHSWPEDPTSAMPTSRTKHRR